MPTLHWIGKDAIIGHHEAVPRMGLSPVPELNCGDVSGGNRIIEGDNLLALRALTPTYTGQVKCIYIDPPYNTGTEGWIYDDNVNSPAIRAWLGQVVGKEGETLDRHDRWLCMMYPRLALLRQLLRSDGVIFISIDDHELANLVLVMDELFGRECRLAIFTWVRKKKGSNLSKAIRKTTEYVVAYKRTDTAIELHGAPAYDEKLVPLLNRANAESCLRFPAAVIRVGRGVPDGRLPAGVRGHDKGELAVRLENDVVVADGIIRTAFSATGRWRWSQEVVDHEIANGSRFMVSKDFRINVARFDQATKFKAPASLLSPCDGIGTNEDATEELRDIFPERTRLAFDYPKPTSLVEHLVRAVCKDDLEAIVLDSFAGSGTTGHAVLRLNHRDGGRRRFVLVQMPHESDESRDAGRNVARDVTAERLRRVIQGYVNARGESVEGLGGGFRYDRLEALARPVENDDESPKRRRVLR